MSAKRSLPAIVLLLILILTGCTTAASTEVKSAEDQAKEAGIVFPLGFKIESPSFIGSVYIENLIAEDEVYNFPWTNNLIFAPGARSSWHTHGGMVILVTGGAGYYQEEGKPAQIIREGDVLEIPEGVRHWHGALPDSWFSQIVIYDASYVSDEKNELVADEYYNSLDAVEYSDRTPSETMFPKAERAITFDTFSGPAYVSELLSGANVAGAPGLHYVVFEPGVINNWHTHEGGQILIATDGVGYHQVEGGDVEVLYPGDVAFCPPGVKHWHGGSADTEFAHIATNTNPERPGVEWFGRISAEEYSVLGN